VHKKTRVLVRFSLKNVFFDSQSDKARFTVVFFRFFFDLPFLKDVFFTKKKYKNPAPLVKKSGKKSVKKNVKKVKKSTTRKCV
jgi:hypothetical protein